MRRETPVGLNETDTYHEWAPPPAWRQAVVCCWEQRVGAERAQRVLPDGQADLVFYDSGRVEVVGLQDEVALPVLPGGAVLRGIRLRPAAVAAAFRVPASSLRNCSITADSVLGSRQARRLGNWRELDAWARSIVPDPRATVAVDLLATNSVNRVAEDIAVSERQLRRIVLAEAGLSPKVFQQVLRLQRFVRTADAGVDLAMAAALAGYADQPHLTREVRRFTGLTPTLLILDRRNSPNAPTTALGAG